MKEDQHYQIIDPLLSTHKIHPTAKSIYLIIHKNHLRSPSPHLWTRHHGEGVHDAVRVFLADFGDQKCAHAGASAAAEGVCELEALQAVASLGLLPDHVQHGIDQFGALRVVTLCPVVAGAALACVARKIDVKVKDSETMRDLVRKGGYARLIRLAFEMCDGI